MCLAAKNFESKFKSSKRMPKRVALSIEDNCSFGSWSNGCSVKRYITYKECD